MEDTTVTLRPVRWLSVGEAARILGVHRQTLKRWPVPYHQNARGGHRRYAEADVIAWLERSRHEVAP